VGTLNRFFGLLLGLSLPLVGWASNEVELVSSFTIPNEWVGKLTAGTPRAHLALIPSGGELHGYTISASDARVLAKAKVIIGINPQLEPWLAEWAKANQREKDLLWLSPAPLPSGSHLWIVPAEVKTMMRRLKKGLDTAGIETSEGNLVQALKEIESVEKDVWNTFAPLLPHERQFVTQHPGLEKYAEAFGLKVAGSILESASAESADPSARHYAELLKSIRTQKVRVILCDEGQNPAAAQQLAKDASLPPPTALTFEYLQKRGTPGDTWASMMRLNARKLAEALKQP
jgi:manganese/iron transport system substrate-binding protein